MKFSAAISGLESGVTYYFKAYAKVKGTESYATTLSTFSGDALSFTTPLPEALPTPAIADKYTWFELPAATTANTNYFVSTTTASGARNYSYLYDKSMFTALWVAYPLHSSHTSGSGSASWKRNPSLIDAVQINVWSGSYGVKVLTDTTDRYARGHQIPNGDRKGRRTMK